MSDKTARLVFEEYPDDPIVLRLSPVPLGDYLDFVEQWDAVTTLSELRAAFVRFSTLALVDGEDLMTRDLGFAKAVVVQWLMAVRDVEPPLLAGSSVIAQYAEDSTAQPANRSARRANSRARASSTRSSGRIPATR